MNKLITQTSHIKMCKYQYKIVGFLSYKNVGKPTILY